MLGMYVVGTKRVTGKIQAGFADIVLQFPNHNWSCQRDSKDLSLIPIKDPTTGKWSTRDPPINGQIPDTFGINSDSWRKSRNRMMRRSLLVNIRTSRRRKSDAFLEPLNNYSTVFFAGFGFNWMSLLPWALLSVSPSVGSPLLSVERLPSFISFSLVQLLVPSFAFSLAGSTCRSDAIFIVSRRPEPLHSTRMRRP